MSWSFTMCYRNRNRGSIGSPYWSSKNLCDETKDENINDCGGVQGQGAERRGRFHRLFRRGPRGGGPDPAQARQGNDEAAAAALPLRLYAKMQSWLSMLPRDPWMWTHLLVVNIFGRLSVG